MKQSYELFQAMKPETANAVFQYMRDEQRDVYKASISSLAANRKLRPVFVQRKPVPEQIDWLVKNVKLRGSGEIAGQVLQLWLLKGHTAVLTAFLDGLGISHDGEGATEDIPDSLDGKKLKSTVAALLKKHDAELVRVYLHLFQLQRSEGWPELSKLIEDTPELQFVSEPGPGPEPVPAPAPAPEPTTEDPTAEEAPSEEAPSEDEEEE